MFAGARFGKQIAPNIPLFAGSNHPPVAFTARSRAGKLSPLEGSVRSEDFLRELDSMAKDPRFSRLSVLDLQNILTAIELCGLGFGAGEQVCEDLNSVLHDEWPAGSPGRRTR